MKQASSSSTADVFNIDNTRKLRVAAISHNLHFFAGYGYN